MTTVAIKKLETSEIIYYPLQIKHTVKSLFLVHNITLTLTQGEGQLKVKLLQFPSCITITCNYMHKWQLCKFVLYKLGYNPGEKRVVIQVHCTAQIRAIVYLFYFNK